MDLLPADVVRILREARRIAVVGISPRPERDSHRVAVYLLAAGYEIVPVNPLCVRVLGLRCWPSLRDVPGSIDVVDVFRRPELVEPVVDDALAIGARVLWLQEGVINENAAARARAAGLTVVMDRCTMRDHATLGDGTRPCP